MTGKNCHRLRYVFGSAETMGYTGEAQQTEELTMTEESVTPEDDEVTGGDHEPDFDVDPTDEDEIRMTEEVQARNRKRVLIPLILLLLLYTVLSFIGPPADDKAEESSDVMRLNTP